VSGLSRLASEPAPAFGRAYEYAECHLLGDRGRLRVRGQAGAAGGEPPSAGRGFAERLGQGVRTRPTLTQAVPAPAAPGEQSMSLRGARFVRDRYGLARPRLTVPTG
jgi:hypothetical protein